MLSGSTVSKLTPSASTDATNPTIYNVPATLANTEYSQALTAGTKMYTIRVRGLANMQLAYTSGQTNINFIKIPRGTTRSVGPLNFSGTLYFELDQPGQVVEIEQWT